MKFSTSLLYFPLHASYMFSVGTLIKYIYTLRTFCGIYSTVFPLDKVHRVWRKPTSLTANKPPHILQFVIKSLTETGIAPKV